jgi:hypothetical protein
LASNLLGYVDPQSGSLAIQFLIAAIVSAGIVMRHYVFWPVTWIVRRFRGQGRVTQHAGN